MGFKKRKQNVKIVSAIVFLSVVSLLFSCGKNSGQSIIVAGSTSVQPYAEMLAEEYMHLYPEMEIDVQGGGSSAGISAVESGVANIGMSSRDLNDKEQVLWSVEIAKDGLAIIINPNNPVTDLTLRQVHDIYTADIDNWSDLGGPDKKIHIIAREEGSGTRSAFESLVMNTDQITPKAIVQDSNGSVRQLVSSDQYAIGYISLGLVDQTVKAVELDGVTPTWDNVVNGSYALYRPFLFVTESLPAGNTKQFIDFTLSSVGQQLLLYEGLIPTVS